MKTNLYNDHIRLNAKMVDFAGYQMPINYSQGINAECKSVRLNAGIFDVSHMGQILIKGEKSVDFVQYLTTNDVSKIKTGQCQYTLICNNNGGIIDDLILYRLKDGFLLVVNASNVDKNLKWIISHQINDVNISNLSEDISLIALQGPNSRKFLSNFSEFKEILSDLKFYHFHDYSDSNNFRIISRTGYTGELGYEIYGNHDYIKSMWKLLIDEFKVPPIGLAARDILRIEMRYLLYGNDMNDDITPYECGLNWVTSENKIDFIGKDKMLSVKKDLDKKLIGLYMNDRCIPRKGYKIHNKEGEIGYITSGTFSPNINKGIALGYINNSNTSSQIFVKIRESLFSATITKDTFIKGNSLFE